MKRRDFIKVGIGTAGIISLSKLPTNLIAANSTKQASDIVELGKTGIKVSRIAMGTGSHGWRGSSNQTRQLGIKGLAELLNYAKGKGVFFWDSADQYGTHPHLKEALKSAPRDKVVILSKTHASTEEEMKSDLERFKNEIGTDYIDIILLHAIRDGNWPEIKAGAMSVLSKAREDGVVRAHGISCHTIEALETAAKSDWVQVDLVRFNPDGVHMDASPEKVASVIKKMKNRGVGIIGMKVFGAGKLIHKYDECLAYHINSNLIDASTIGFESIQQFDEVVKKIPEVSK